MLYFQQQDEIKKSYPDGQCNIKNKQLGALIPPLHLCHPILSPHINCLYTHPLSISLCPLTPHSSFLANPASILHPPTHPHLPFTHQTLSSFPPTQSPTYPIQPSTIIPSSPNQHPSLTSHLHHPPPLFFSTHPPLAFTHPPSLSFTYLSSLLNHPAIILPCPSTHSHHFPS
ncbi:hypothetical protein Pmani_025393 [Petrolisthes manimaculis]|uniref:Uncharacterized protein n=1 Tax=Petrolisthes manimaculis TaxID=1843537 RepID=A0AAE1P871_9EUCA|nr:hypothetical protein Pmani_025393 [Petrolisthes manimaculis]